MTDQDALLALGIVPVARRNGLAATLAHETVGTTGQPETDVYAQYTGCLENRPHACGTNTDEKFSDADFR